MHGATGVLVQAGGELSEDNLDTYTVETLANADRLQ